MQDGREYEEIEPVSRNKELVSELIELKLNKVRQHIHSTIFKDRAENVTFGLPDLLQLKKNLDKWIKECEQITGVKAK